MSLGAGGVCIGIIGMIILLFDDLTSLEGSSIGSSLKWIMLPTSPTTNMLLGSVSYSPGHHVGLGGYISREEGRRGYITSLVEG